jgi:branched-chain amino acid transport system substrate-binding protein
MKKRILSLALGACLTAGLLSGCGSGTGSASGGGASASAAGGEAGTIAIGGIFDTSGIYTAYDQPAANGFQLAVEEINAAGGIDGRQIDYKFVNGQSSATENSNAATKLIEKDKVAVIAGNCVTDDALAGGTIAQDNGVPYVTVGATLPDLPDRVGDCFYLACYGDNVQAYASAEYAYNELGARTAYVIEDNTSEYTQALSKYFQKHFTDLGGQIVLTDTYDENGYTDFSAEISKVNALATKPDVLFFASFTEQGGIMLKQFRTKGLDMPVLSGDGFDDTSIADVAGDAAENAYYTTHVDYTSSDPKVTAFIDNYTKKFGNAPENAFAALGYDTAYLIKYAIENDANGDLSAESIKNAIGQVSGFKGITGTISYENGSHVPSKTVTINKFSNGSIEHVTDVTPNMG